MQRQIVDPGLENATDVPIRFLGSRLALHK